LSTRSLSQRSRHFRAPRPVRPARRRDTATHLPIMP
jgi:hypothetical protein